MDSSAPSDVNDASAVSVPPPTPDPTGASARTNQAIEEAKQKFEALLEEGTQFVRQNPGKAIAAALGVGFVIGLLVKD